MNGSWPSSKSRFFAKPQLLEDLLQTTQMVTLKLFAIQRLHEASGRARHAFRPREAQQGRQLGVSCFNAAAKRNRSDTNFLR
jgi:hypothetical protein